VHVLFGALQILEHASGALEDAAPRCRQHHAPAEPQEKRRLEPRLDVAKLMAQRRLRQVQAGSRLRHAAGLGNLAHEP
jgi:hypothetical protein